ncbi:MAG: endo alpha-1,4 polygalactosaminidase [Anaerolineales bacterium]
MNRNWLWLLLLPLLAACTPSVRAADPGEPTPTPAAYPYPEPDLYLPLAVREYPIPPRWQPAPGTSWQIQYTGELDTSLNVQIYNLDLFDTPQSVIDSLHQQNRRVICYFSAGSWEDWRPDAANFAPELLGNPLEGWQGEQWLDIRRLDLLTPLMEARLNLAYQKGCDAVDPDNVNGYTNNTGFPLTAADQLAYNRFLAQAAHSRNLAIGLKNDLDQIPDLVNDFDFAVNEECFTYNECNLLQPFTAANKPVFGIQYDLAPETFCPQANALNLDFLAKHWELDAWRVACR